MLYVVESGGTEKAHTARYLISGSHPEITYGVRTRSVCVPARGPGSSPWILMG